jgi:membrane-associated phospholipid phosphatase
VRINGLALAVLLGAVSAATAADTGVPKTAASAPKAVAGPAKADADAASATPPLPSPLPPLGNGAGDVGRRTLRRLPANLGRGLVGVVHGDNLVSFIAGGTAAGAASFFDQDVRNNLQSNTFNWSSALETGAGPVWSSVFVAGMFTAGQLSHHSRFQAMTYDMLDAAVVNLVYTEVIKVAARRERPNGQDNQSFPSGHTSNSFALAAVAERHYGWKLGVPAYLLAGIVGASRLEQDKHYLSDVVAGATLGYIVGRTVVRVNSRPLGDGAHRGAALRVSPILARSARGAQLAVVF